MYTLFSKSDHMLFASEFMIVYWKKDLVALFVNLVDWKNMSPDGYNEWSWIRVFEVILSIVCEDWLNVEMATYTCLHPVHIWHFLNNNEKLKIITICIFKDNNNNLCK